MTRAEGRIEQRERTSAVPVSENRSSLWDGTDEALRSEHIAPIEKLALADQIIDRLGGWLGDGVLKPGDKLPSERALCTALGVSRQSLRQALKALDVLGVIEIKHGSGVFIGGDMTRLMVNPLKFMLMAYRIQDSELIEMRKAIEVELAGLAAERADDADVCRMESHLVNAEAQLDNMEQFLNHLWQFHREIFHASGNRIMETIMVSIDGLVQKSRLRTANINTDLRMSLNENWEIFKGIRDKTPDAARRAMFSHLSRLQRKLAQKPETGC